MKYYIEYRAWLGVEVEAESKDEALKLAGEKWYHVEPDDKDVRIIEGEAYYIRQGGFEGTDEDFETEEFLD